MMDVSGLYGTPDDGGCYGCGLYNANANRCETTDNDQLASFPFARRCQTGRESG